MSDSTGMRLSALAIVAVSLIGALTARLWFLTAVEGEAAVQAATANRIRTLHIQAPRGRILDRNKQVLVDNRQIRQVQIDTRELDESVGFEDEGRHEVYDRLADLLNIDREVPELGITADIPVDPDVIGRAARITALDEGASDQEAITADNRAKEEAEAAGPETTDWTGDLVAAALEENFLGAFLPTPIADDVPEAVEVALAERQVEFPGVAVERVAVRHYPHGSLAAHALGYVGPISGQEEIDEIQNPAKPYELSDEVGRGGVEGMYEVWLRGVPGERVIEVDAEGDVVQQLDYTAPQPGMDLVLSLDVRVQALLEQQLTAVTEANESPGGAGVVLDPRDGSVVAMASVPTYEPTAFINGIGNEEFEELTDPESGNALLNRAVAGEYAPGSTFKVVTAIAGLRGGVVNGPAESFYDDGIYEVRGCEEDPSCWFQNAGQVENGTVNLQTSLTVSSDWYYYRIGDNLWGRREQIGDDYLQQTARDFGFASRTGVDLPGEREGFAFTPSIMDELHEENPEAFPYDGDDWRSGNTINMSIGQGDLGVTPLQLTNAYAALANGGTLYRPHLAQAVWDPGTDSWTRDPATSCRGTRGDDAGRLRDDGVVCTLTPVQLGAVELPAQWRDPMMAGLLGVQHEGGTASTAFEGFDLASFPIAGKTGTSQVEGKGDFALYVGFGPVRPGQSPEYVVSVVIEDVGAFGGDVAAPVARAVFDGLADPAALPMVPSTEATPVPSTDTMEGTATTPTTVVPQ